MIESGRDLLTQFRDSMPYSGDYSLDFGYATPAVKKVLELIEDLRFSEGNVIELTLRTDRFRFVQSYRTQFELSEVGENLRVEFDLAATLVGSLNGDPTLDSLIGERIARLYEKRVEHSDAIHLILVGLPAVGKTTVQKQLMCKYDLVALPEHSVRNPKLNPSFHPTNEVYLFPHTSSEEGLSREVVKALLLALTKPSNGTCYQPRAELADNLGKVSRMACADSVQSGGLVQYLISNQAYRGELPFTIPESTTFRSNLDLEEYFLRIQRRDAVPVDNVIKTLKDSSLLRLLRTEMRLMAGSPIIVMVKPSEDVHAKWVAEQKGPEIQRRMRPLAENFLLLRIWYEALEIMLQSKILNVRSLVYDPTCGYPLDYFLPLGFGLRGRKSSEPVDLSVHAELSNNEALNNLLLVQKENLQRRVIAEARGSLSPLSANEASLSNLSNSLSRLEA